METFLVSSGIVALAEIGDKTQLLALMLAARFRKPWPILWGILIATIANHALAALAGSLAAQWLGENWLGSQTFQIILGASFIAMAAWTLVPDKADDDAPGANGRSAFMATLIAFFIIEMGDKTQVATLGLAATYGNILLVTLGTTVGMMIANAPAVVVGDRIAHRLPLGLIRSLAAVSFALLGLYELADGLGWLALL